MLPSSAQWDALQLSYSLASEQPTALLNQVGFISRLLIPGVGISAMGVLRPDLIMKCVVPVVMAGIIAIYGLVVSVLVSDGLSQNQALYTGFIQLGAGLSVGLAGLAAGFAIGIVGDAGVRGVAQQPRLFVGMILILIFSEVLGLYGLIVALLLNTKATEGVTC